MASFNFEAYSWRSLRPLPKTVRRASALEHHGRILLVGGTNSKYAAETKQLRTIFEFRPGEDQNWIERKEKLKKGRSGHVALPLKSGWREIAKVCT